MFILAGQIPKYKCNEHSCFSNRTLKQQKYSSEIYKYGSNLKILIIIVSSFNNIVIFLLQEKNSELKPLTQQHLSVAKISTKQNMVIFTYLNNIF